MSLVLSKKNLTPTRIPAITTALKTTHVTAIMTYFRLTRDFSVFSSAWYYTKQLFIKYMTDMDWIGGASDSNSRHVYGAACRCFGHFDIDIGDLYLSNTIPLSVPQHACSPNHTTFGHVFHLFDCKSNVLTVTPSIPTGGLSKRRRDDESGDGTLYTQPMYSDCYWLTLLHLLLVLLSFFNVLYPGLFYVWLVLSRINWTELNMHEWATAHWAQRIRLSRRLNHAPDCAVGRWDSHTYGRYHCQQLSRRLSPSS